MKSSGNTILITGGTSGIGLAFARQFIKDDNRVIVCGRRAGRLEQIAKELPGIVTKMCDVANASQRQELCTWVLITIPH
jgi:uncharacterized oxidoreductase